MDSKDIVGIILALLVPLVTGALGAVGVAFQDWRAGRSRLGRRKTAVEDARAQVGFVAEWWSAQQELDRTPEALQAARSVANAMLERASTTIAATQLPLPRGQSPSTTSRLLLLYPFGSWAGRFVRAAFYVSCWATVMALGTSVSQQLNQRADEQGWVNAYLAMGGLLAGLTLGLRFLAAEVEENAVSAASHGESNWGFVRRMLLLHRLRRPSSRFVRLVFYLAVVGVGVYLAYAAELSWSRWTITLLPTFVPAALGFALAAVGLRSWAVLLEPTPSADGLDTGPAGPADPTAQIPSQPLRDGALAAPTTRDRQDSGIRPGEQGASDVATVS